MFCKTKYEKQLKSVQGMAESCKNDEYTIGYYNGLEYAISLLTGKEPCYKMYEVCERDENMKKEDIKRTKGGYIIKSKGV